jgi:hypothetical protein
MHGCLELEYFMESKPETFVKAVKYIDWREKIHEKIDSRRFPLPVGKMA